MMGAFNLMVYQQGNRSWFTGNKSDHEQFVKITDIYGLVRNGGW